MRNVAAAHWLLSERANRLRVKGRRVLLNLQGKNMDGDMWCDCLVNPSVSNSLRRLLRMIGIASFEPPAANCLSE